MVIKNAGSISFSYDSWNWGQNHNWHIQLTQEPILETNFGISKDQPFPTNTGFSRSTGGLGNLWGQHPANQSGPFGQPQVVKASTKTSGTGARIVWKDGTQKSEASSFFRCSIYSYHASSKRGPIAPKIPRSSPITFTSKSNSSMIDLDFVGVLSAWSQPGGKSNHNQPNLHWGYKSGYPFVRPQTQK